SRIHSSRGGRRASQLVEESRRHVSKPALRRLRDACRLRRLAPQPPEWCRGDGGFETRAAFGDWLLSHLSIGTYAASPKRIASADAAEARPEHDDHECREHE